VNSRIVSLAKTTRPSLTGILPRDRLFAALDAARSKSVIWLTGPPGCGKTTLAASYLERTKLPSLWYQIDEGDADVASFFYYLGLAAGELRRKPALRLPQLAPEYHAGIAPFARRYFQALHAHLGAPFALVLDGYHEVPTQSLFHEAIRIALSETPPDCCFTLISRSDPPPIMARLRANQAMEVIGWHDVRLTQQESNAIVCQRGHTLPEHALTELYARTQGWAAGLILTLEQVVGRDSIEDVADLSTPQLVFDYLAGEVFQKTDTRTQTFLLNTAYVPQMTAGMATSMTGEADAGAILAHMHSNNYFVTLKQAKPQPVYQYHPLLREFLLSRVEEAFSKETRSALKRQAAMLLEQQDSISDCVSLLREIADWERMVQVIRKHAEAMLNRGMAETLAQWVVALPKEVQQQNPWTLYWVAVARMHASPRESRILHEQAFDLFRAQAEPDVMGQLLTCSGAMDAILYELDDFTLLDRWIPIMDLLLKQHPESLSHPAGLRLVTSLLTSMVIRQPHHPDLEKWVECAYRASVGQNDPNLRMLVEPRVAIAIIWGGHYPKAWAVIEGMRRVSAQHEISPFALNMLKVAEAMYFMLTAQHDECLKAVREGIDIERTAGVSVASHQLLAFGAGGALTCGDLDTAKQLLDEFANQPSPAARCDLSLYHLFSTWHAMLSGDSLRSFQQQKLALRAAVEVGCPYFEVLCRLATAHVLYESGEHSNAMAQFQQIYDLGRSMNNRLLEYTGWMCYAQVALEDGRRKRSGLWALREALKIGKPRNYSAFTLWRPETLARVMSRALEARVETDYAIAIIRRRGLTLDAAQFALSIWPWRFKVHTMGEFRLFRDNVPDVPSGRAQKRPIDLLKVLIAEGGRQVSEVRITEALWPRIDGDSAHRSFTSALHRLRRHLGEDRALVLSEGKLSLDGRFVWTDTWAFEQLTAQIDQSVRGGRERVDGLRASVLAERLLELYAGPFLSAESDETWTDKLRQRMRNRFVRAAGDITRWWQQAGETEHAVDYLHRTLDVDDLAEGMYRQLMQFLSALGRRAEAVELYARCRSALARLGVEPSVETRQLYEKLLQA
jgi:ATP/maltotriose-dependent transcriptional regulator MalT/DNA-binding SARP family transcriptional activator